VGMVFSVSVQRYSDTGSEQSPKTHAQLTSRTVETGQSTKRGLLGNAVCNGGRDRDLNPRRPPWQGACGVAARC